MPCPSDLSLEDDIERIRNNRNVIGHCPKAEMSDDEFNTHWAEMEGICQRADTRRPGNSYFQVINVTFMFLLCILIIISSSKHNI